MPPLPARDELRPFWSHPRGLKFYQGDVREVLAKLPAGSVHCCVTSPPYWSLRSYLPSDHPLKGYELGGEPSPDCGSRGQAQCGACFVCNLVGVFRQVRRVLHDSGCAFLNLGDSYACAPRGYKQPGGGNLTNSNIEGKGYEKARHESGKAANKSAMVELPQGSLLGIPWRVALALQEDGWLLRSDIPWVKRACLPESVESRPGKSLEYVFLLAKGGDYFYDHVAVRSATRNFRNSDLWVQSVDGPHGLVTTEEGEPVGLDVVAKGYKGAHYAVFPAKLVEPMILAGTSAHGCCARCGSPYKRVTTREKLRRERPNEHVKYAVDDTRNSCGNGVAGVKVETLGWEATCGCVGAGVKPCTVGDIFLGSGTVAEVCVRHGRHCVGVELNETYLRENAIPRAQAALEEFSGRKGG